MISKEEILLEELMQEYYENNELGILFKSTSPNLSETYNMCAYILTKSDVDIIKYLNTKPSNYLEHRCSMYISMRLKFYNDDVIESVKHNDTLKESGIPNNIDKLKKSLMIIV